jgi:hypothetical protein
LEVGTSRLFSEIGNNEMQKKTVLNSWWMKTLYDKAPTIAAMLWHMISGMLLV